MLWVKSAHIIALVAWFAGLFYLPRLFVYHAQTTDEPGNARFRQMERRLYYGIMWPAAVLTTIFGVWLMSYSMIYYLKAGYMHVKLALVLLLWFYHASCGHFLKKFQQQANRHSALFFRFYNEIPTVLLIGIVILVVVKPV